MAQIGSPVSGQRQGQTPSNSTAMLLQFAAHAFGYVVPSTPQTGEKIAEQIQLQGPFVAFCCSSKPKDKATALKECRDSDPAHASPLLLEEDADRWYEDVWRSCGHAAP